MTKEEKLSIAKEVVKIYFDENLSVKEAIKRAKKYSKKKVMN